jgi:sugar-specific transcriptional regulator TrmB
MLSLLTKFGLSPKMIDVYFALLQNPDISILTLSNTLKINRTSLYNYLIELKDRGLAYKMPNSNWRAVDPEVVMSDFQLDLRMLKLTFDKLGKDILESSHTKYFDNKYSLFRAILEAIKVASNVVVISGNCNLLLKIKKISLNKKQNLIVYSSVEDSSEFVSYFLKYLDFMDLILLDGKLFIIFRDGLFGLLLEDKVLYARIESYI